MSSAPSSHRHASAPTSDYAEAFFLPDFCSARSVLAVVLIVELVAITFTVARQALHQNFWVDLASCSLFLLWLGLGCAAILCRARPRLSRMSIEQACVVMLGLLVTVVAVVSELVYQVGQLWGSGLADVNSVFPQDHAGFLLRNLAVGFIVSALALRYFYVAAQWKRHVEAVALARIRALQARIRPHFLFNSMNTIAALTRSNPERAEAAVEDLADLFRASLSEANVQIPLKDELEIARTHERIERLRLGERLQVVWDVQELPPRTLVPSLIIQPLLENAVYHGIEALPGGGTVSIVGRHSGHVITIEVRNPIPVQAGYGEREGNRIALENIRQRLELAWPGLAGVEVEQREREFLVRLRFPSSEPSLTETSFESPFITRDDTIRVTSSP
jgi:two-component system, LytTR family, sensor histidine kinase AlgZ